MSVILALIPAIVVGLPLAIVNSAAQAAGIKLIDERKIKEKNARRMGELLQKKQLNLMEKKELKLLQLGGNQPVFSTETQQQPKPLPADELIIPTSIRNIEFLLKTLQELGIRQVAVKEDIITANFSQLSVIYQPDDNGYIGLHFRGNVRQEDAYEFKDLLETQYGKLLQEAVYHQIKQKAEEEGLRLENEQIEENDTITLTYHIK